MKATTMNIINVLSYLAVTMISSVAFGRCLENPYGNLNGSFKVLKVETARLKCSVNESGTHLVNTFVNVAGCVLDLKPFVSSQKAKHYPTPIHLYADNNLCEKKAGEVVKLHIGEGDCEKCTKLYAEFGVVRCKENPKPQIMSERPIPSEYLACMSGWTEISNDDPR
jgi:hypothetical protein